MASHASRKSKDLMETGVILTTILLLPAAPVKALRLPSLCYFAAIPAWLFVIVWLFGR